MIANLKTDVKMAKKPNILFIFTDHVGYGAPSCYNRGILDTPTPRIDQLAADNSCVILSGI